MSACEHDIDLPFIALTEELSLLLVSNLESSATIRNMYYVETATRNALYTRADGKTFELP